MKYAIILNGPPGVGKDTISSRLVNVLPSSREMRFKDYLTSEVVKMYNIDSEYWRRNYNNRKWKEQRNPFLDGLTPRQAMIFVSEDVIKPERGKDYFGKCALADIQASDCLYHVFSDGGFIEEIQALDSDDVGICLFRLYREGYSFEGDSRDYVQYPGSYDITLQDGEIDKGVKAIRTLINQ